MREKIGEAAGKVWKKLGEANEINVLQLPRLLREDNETTFQALGWLAHEGKLVYRRDKNKNFVSLTPEEKNIFRTIN
ncbi:hypothetical protein COT42_03400 [Candidatus Saganbacteria bacterium CG08_land_8_20_14_0_20_45_16]|uniref:Winged helix-turn-helix domain-containing protein n=1 Tax=Candidatus Saganbacteria bacterium CG08_land_8_20_14_0_20_45_16 TaxID=2014293 RepID=A0A2H0XYV1_UNCSA|nr:MAG: hypothetical protein COT42_03400 [Candidatus Saganbacteria bacterium CG08_land_8_20_14_0_20_45_16]